MTKRIGFIILLSILFQTSWSQNSVEKFDFVSIKDGISKVGIYSIIQDHEGFIWLGTNGAGLYRYDGLNYQSYKYAIDDPSSLSSSLVSSIYLDQNKRLWIGTDDGLNLYDRSNNSFIRISNSKFNVRNGVNVSITSIEEDVEGSLLIGTLELGLFKMNPKTLNVLSVVSKESLDSSSLSVNAIQLDSSGVVLVATNRGLRVYDSKLNTLKSVESKDLEENKLLTGPIESLVMDANNSIWAGTSTNGLLKLSSLEKARNEKLTIEVQSFSFSKNQFLSLLAMPDGSILCGTENDGLYHINDSGTILNHYRSGNSDKSSILSNSIWSLYLDKDQRIWLGYYNKGVSVYDTLYDKFNEVQNLPLNDNSLQHGSVTAVVQDQNAKFWIATDGGGIDVWDKETNQFTHISTSNNGVYSGLRSDYIECLFIDSKQNIWAGSWDRGIFVLEKGAREFKNFTIESTAGGLISNTILTITEDQAGTVWIGTFNGGLHSYDSKDQSFTHYDDGSFAKYNLSDIEVRKVIVDLEENLWLGTTIGLFKVSKKPSGKWEAIPMRNKMPQGFKNHNSSNSIISLFQSKEGTIWIGTRGAGLCSYDPLKDDFVWYNSSTGLEEENVNGIQQSLDGNLWIAGNNGLTKFNFTEDLFTNYNTLDGLLSNDYNINSTFRDRNGLLYFGNFQGIDYFDPNAIEVNKNLPSLYLTDFKIFNETVVPNQKDSPLHKVIAQTDSLVLNSKQSVFTIEYSTINYTRPESNEYAYYLEGYENTWNYVGKKRSATYTNLDPGDYVFKLKSSNNDGLWIEEPLTLHITILPPWWKTIWATILYVILFFASLYFVARFAQNQLKSRQLVENERNARLLEKELVEKKLQFFTNISHEFRTPLSLIIGPLEDIIKNDSLALSDRIKEKHLTIHKNTNRLTRLINELLDFRKLDLGKVRIKVREVQLVSFVKNIGSHFKEEAFIKNIHFTIDADIKDLTVWADESMLEKIIFNILSNAFKVTPEGGAITVELSYSDKPEKLPLASAKKRIEAVIIKISDTGPGLQKLQIKRIFDRFYQVDNLNKTYYGGTGIGLEVVQSFVTLHKGRIKVKSAIDQGTSFKILLPAGKQYFSEEEIFIENVETPLSDQSFVPEPSATAIKEGQGLKIDSNSRTLLIVEDNTELRNYLKSELKYHYKILLAKNGEEGLRIALESLPDVIITDVIMPEMDGFEFCKRIKKDLKTSHIPLLMLTAKTTIENRMEGIENGADAYMVKPFDMGLLRLRLSQLITSRQLIFNKYFSVISDADNNNATSMDKEFVEKVMSIINKNISDPDLNVESLASQMNLSRSQFYRKIKSLTNQTANEFIRNIRLIKAKQLIETGNKNISEVCYQVGFSSPSYFSKCFKSYFGVLPKEVPSK